MCLVVHVKQKRPERLSSALGTLFPPFLHSRPLRAKTRLRPQTPSASQTAPMPSFRQAQGLLLGPRDQAHRPGFDRRLGFLRAMRRFLVLRAWRAHTRRARETRRWQRASCWTAGSSEHSTFARCAALGGQRAAPSSGAGSAGARPRAGQTARETNAGQTAFAPEGVPATRWPDQRHIKTNGVGEFGEGENSARAFRRHFERNGLPGGGSRPPAVIIVI